MLSEELRPQNLPEKKRRFLKYKLEQDYKFFVKYFFYVINGFQFQWNWHHDEIVNALMRVIRGETKNLIINMPPRYSKTELVVVLFVAWCFARWQKARFIHLSYSNELALDNSSRIRELISLPEYQALWGVSLKADSDAKALWKTSANGGIKAGAAGGAVTGFGAGLPVMEDGEFGGCILIDDPLKPDDADSDTKRNRVNNRAVTTIPSRKNHPNTPIIVVMQRLHDMDYTGFLTDGGTNDDYEVLELPALAVNDEDQFEALWPAKHSVNDLLEMQANIRTKFIFSSQYQQKPIPDDGDFFKKSMVCWYDELPNDLTFYGSSDYAETDGSEEGKDPDFTEHGIFGINKKDDVYVADWWFGQTKTNVWADEEVNLLKLWNPVMWARPGDSIGKAVYPYIAKEHEKESVYVSTEWISASTHNKIAQARSFQGLWDSKKIYLPRNEPWALRLLQQLSRFPKGRYDDAVDTCSHFARMIHKVWATEKSKKPEKDQRPIDAKPTLNDLLKPVKKQSGIKRI